jgi:hypothetical protein
MSRHQHLPWKEKREEYFRQTGKWRSISSLGSKLEKLDQGIRRRRPLYEEVVQRGYAWNLFPQRSLLEELPPSPRPLILKTPDPLARRILEQWRQAEVYQDTILAKSMFPGEVFTPLSTPLSRNPSIPSKDCHNSSPTEGRHADRFWIRKKWKFFISTPKYHLLDYNTHTHTTAIPKEARDWGQSTVTTGHISN